MNDDIGGGDANDDGGDDNGGDGGNNSSDGGDNDVGNSDKEYASSNDVDFDNVNAGYGENKVDLCHMYSGGGYRYDGDGVDDVDEINGAANDGDGDSKADCGWWW